MDGAGNVNVSKMNDTINDPGGFIDITQNAKEVVFCGTFDAKGARMELAGGELHVLQHGRVRKLVREVAHLTFSGIVARRRGQRVLYVTERAGGCAAHRSGARRRCTARCPRPYGFRADRG